MLNLIQSLVPVHDGTILHRRRHRRVHHQLLVRFAHVSAVVGHGVVDIQVLGSVDKLKTAPEVQWVLPDVGPLTPILLLISGSTFLLEPYLTITMMVRIVIQPQAHRR